MPSLRHACVCLAAWFSLTAGLAAETSPRIAARWQMIHYPPLEMPGTKGQTAMIIVGSDHWNEKPSLRFDLVCSLSDTASPPPALAAADQIRVRLHLPDGSILEPTNNQPESAAGASMGGGTSWNRTYFFPWGPNALDEGWFELQIADRTYWVEAPYGFTRDPSAPLAPEKTARGRPAPAPAMKDAPKDHIIPWTKIDYDLGQIQNNWRLLLELSNPFDGKGQVVLYRENGKWELSQPPTSLQIVDDGGGLVKARQVSARFSDVFRRVDDYDYNRYALGLDQRSWGTLTVTVDGRAMEAIIPSSLFKYTHGRVPMP